MHGSSATTRTAGSTSTSRIAPVLCRSTWSRRCSTISARSFSSIARALEPGRPWGWKEPRSIYLLPFLHRHLPSLRFLHVVRDGRDMALSANQNQLRKHGDAAAIPADLSPPERSIALWSWVNLTAARYGEEHLRRPLPAHQVRRPLCATRGRGYEDSRVLRARGRSGCGKPCCRGRPPRSGVGARSRPPRSRLSRSRVERLSSRWDTNGRPLSRPTYSGSPWRRLTRTSRSGPGTTGAERARSGPRAGVARTPSGTGSSSPG